GRRHPRRTQRSPKRAAGVVRGRCAVLWPRADWHRAHSGYAVALFTLQKTTAAQTGQSLPEMHGPAGVTRPSALPFQRLPGPSGSPAIPTVLLPPGALPVTLNLFTTVHHQGGFKKRRSRSADSLVRANLI